MFPYGITVTVETLGQDRYGNRTVATSATVPGCAFAPGPSTEQMDGRDEVAEQGNLYAPAGTAFAPTDRIVLPDGTTWEVNGTPSAWASPWTGWNPGIAIPLKRVVG